MLSIKFLVHHLNKKKKKKKSTKDSFSRSHSPFSPYFSVHRLAILFIKLLNCYKVLFVGWSRITSIWMAIYHDFFQSMIRFEFFHNDTNNNNKKSTTLTKKKKQIQCYLPAAGWLNKKKHIDAICRLWW